MGQVGRVWLPDQPYLPNQPDLTVILPENPEPDARRERRQNRRRLLVAQTRSRG